MMDWLFCTTTPQLFWQLCPNSSRQIINWKQLDIFAISDLFDETQLDIFANWLMQQNLVYWEKAPLLIIQTLHFLQLFNEVQLIVSLLSQKETALMAIGHFSDSRDYVRGRNIKSTLIFLTVRTIGRLGPEQFLANIRRQILGKRDSHSKSRKVIITSV